MPDQSLADQDKIYLEMRAKVIWGEDRESVAEFLQEKGIAEPLATEFYQRARAERAADIRAASFGRALSGALILTAGVLLYCAAKFEWVPDYHTPGRRGYNLYQLLVILGVGGFLWGAWRLVDGGFSYFSAGKL